MIKNVPKMVRDIIKRDRLECSSCKKEFYNDDLSLIGIQSSVHVPLFREVLAIGFMCHKCEEMTIFELQDMTVKEFSSMIFDKSKTSSKKKDKSKKKIVKNNKKK